MCVSLSTSRPHFGPRLLFLAHFLRVCDNNNSWCSLFSKHSFILWPVSEPHAVLRTRSDHAWSALINLNPSVSWTGDALIKCLSSWWGDIIRQQSNLLMARGAWLMVACNKQPENYWWKLSCSSKRNACDATCVNWLPTQTVNYCQTCLRSRSPDDYLAKEPLSCPLTDSWN